MSSAAVRVDPDRSSPRAEAEPVPRVSVIIPTYRRPRLLGAAIQSVLNQTFQDFEIVVVDDNSADNTREVTLSFQDPRIRYIAHRTNWRVGAARNTGLLNSVGDFVAFLDDDDEWLPEKLERQLEVFDRCAPVTGAVYTGFHMMDRRTGRTVQMVRPTKQGHILHELCRHNCVGTASTVVLRRECFEEVGLFDETIDFGEEYDMWIRIAHAFDFQFLPEPLVRYSVHGTRLSTNYALMIRGVERLLVKFGNFFAAYPTDLSRRHLELGVWHCYQGEARRGRKAFRRAIRIAPTRFKNYLYLALALLGARVFRWVRLSSRSNRRPASEGRWQPPPTHEDPSVAARGVSA
jgi:glycosyltransferase involved in cell wall biosynthesis